MAKFRNGQKVRCLVTVRYGDLGIIKGKIYTITDLESAGKVRISGINRWWNVSRFEPYVEENPYVETVTKTVKRVVEVEEEVTEERLKPGVYGNIHISNDGIVYMRSRSGGHLFYADTSLVALGETISALTAIRDFRAAQKK